MPTPGVDFPERVIVNIVEKRIRAIVELVRRFGIVRDESALTEHVTKEAKALRGDGLSLVRFPANITTANMVEVVNAIAVEKGREKIFQRAPYWVPGTEPGSCTADELDDVQDGDAEPELELRMALFAPQPAKDADRLLWFCGVPYDAMYAKGEQATQEQEAYRTITAYEAENDGYGMWTLTHRDFLVLYALDLLMDVPAGKEILSTGWMRTPNLGRKSVDGDSYVGFVVAGGGRAGFYGSRGKANDRIGVGFSTRKKKRK